MRGDLTCASRPASYLPADPLVELDVSFLLFLAFLDFLLFLVAWVPASALPMPALAPDDPELPDEPEVLELPDEPDIPASLCANAAAEAITALPRTARPLFQPIMILPFGHSTTWRDCRACGANDGGVGQGPHP